MFKKIFLVVCGTLFLVCDLAFALSCVRPDPERIVKDFDTVFVAFLTEAHFVEGEEPEDCGWVEGLFEVVKELKGNSDSVSVVRKRLNNCNNSSIAGSSDRFPIGKYILVKSNSDVAYLSSCSPVWDDDESNCLIDGIQRRLNIDATNADLREWCIRNEKSGGEFERTEALRAYVTRLEQEREYRLIEFKELEVELKEMKELLSESETPE